MASLGEFLWPAPISPVFGPEGALAGWNEDAVFSFGMILLLGLVDLGICRPLLSPKSRYFALHAVANTVSTIAALPDLLRVLRDPLHAFSGPTFTMLANSAVISIHAYHCLFFRLPTADIVHHAVFVVVLCGFAIPFKHVGGVSNNFGCFFLSGLPGGINYILLVLVREGRLAPLTQKAWDAWINTWIRGPPMSVYAFLQYQALIYGHGPAMGAPATRAVCIFVIAALHFVNGQYYAAQAVANHAEVQERTKGAGAAGAAGEPATRKGHVDSKGGAGGDRSIKAE